MGWIVNMIDLLSITLSTASAAPPTAHSPASDHQVPIPLITQGYNHSSQAPYNNYFVPWAQPQPYLRPQTQTPPQVQRRNPAQYSSPAYPPPPWPVSLVYSGNQSNNSCGNTVLTSRANGTPTFASEPPAKQLYPYNSFPLKGSPGPTVLGDAVMNLGPRNPPITTGQKPFVPSYRLLEDLNVFRNPDGRLKMSGSRTTSSLAGAGEQSMVSGRK